jgi:tetratricopeptide (TPR) repeat protein
MSSSLRLQTKAVEPIEDRIDSLFREIELSVKWQRPSILFAIYSSEYIHAEMEAVLTGKINALDQKVIRINIDNENNSDITSRISENVAIENVVFFITGLRWGANNGTSLYINLNNQREYIVENRVRLVFWLTEKEVIDLANNAPDFWAFRHRVIEFNDSPRPDQILQSANEPAWQGTGEYTDAVEDLDEKISFRESLLTEMPDGNASASVNGNLMLTLGILHWRKGDYEKASEFLKAALDLALSIKDKLFAAECFNAIALVKTGLGRNDEAIEAYLRAIHLAPNQIFPWNNLGILFSKLGRNEEAVIAFKKAIENKPGDAVSWDGLGGVYLKLNQTAEAIQAYLKAIEFAPNFAAAFCGLGTAFSLEKKTDHAVKAYQRAYSLNNRMAPSIIGLARILAEKGRDEKAVQAYEAALDIDSKNDMAWNELGELCLKSGMYDKAIEAFGMAVELSPNSGIHISNQALAYLEKGVHLEAIPLFEKSLTLLETDEEKALSWNRLGNAYRQIGDYDRAVSAYQCADEYRGLTTTSVFNTTKDIFQATEMPDKENNSEDEVSEPDSLEDVIQISSYLESKESRIDGSSEVTEEPIINESEPEETAQFLDGDNLIMLDKTISEIEEMISRNIGLAPDDKVAEYKDVDPTDDESDNNIDDDAKSALEWNGIGNTHLNSGAYDEAIFAYTKAIESAPEFNWPYIKNLAIAYYHKGKQKEDASLSESEDNDNEENSLDNAGLDTIHELHDLSAEIYNTPIQDNENKTDIFSSQSLPSDEPMLDSSSVNDPLPFDHNTISYDLLQEALQEDMEFSTGKYRNGIPAGRELFENKYAGESTRSLVDEAENSQERFNSGKDKFEVQPQSAYEWNELGNIYLKIGSNDKAIEAFNKAIELDPSFGWAYSNLALAYNHSKKFRESIPLYRTSIDFLDTDKGKAISWNRLGDVYRHLNEQDNAMKAYQMASDLDGNSKPILTRARMVLLNNA